MGDLTKNLSSFEYLPQREYKLYKQGMLPARTFQLMVRPQLIKADQLLIDRYGSFTINDYMMGGSFQFCGYRPSDCKEGSFYGDHRFGGASDKHPKKVTLDEIFEDIRKNPQLFYEMGYRTIEDTSITPGWLHGSIFEFEGQKGIVMVGL